MAYNFVAASNQYITASAPVTDEPATLFARFQTTQASGFYAIIALQDTATGGRILSALVSSNFQTAAIQGGANNALNIAYSANQWNAGGSEFGSSTSRYGYYNATKSAEGTVTVNTNTFNAVSIGARHDGSAYGLPYDGQIAEAAIWSATLTDAEHTSLSKGFKPSRIRPQSLVFYAPLIRNLQDTKGALALTNNNSATVADHPRVY